MRILFTLPFLLSCLASIPAFADSRNLFILQKPVNPENLVQVYVPVGADCKIGNLDFVWLMNRTQPKTPNGILRCNTLKRLRPAAVNPANKAGCPKELPPGAVCYQKFVTADEVSKVDQNVPLVVRSVKSASTGLCSLAAFMDMGTKVVQVKQINANGHLLDQGFTSATVQISGVQIIGVDGSVAADWKCTHDCIEKVSVDLSCTI